MSATSKSGITEGFAQSTVGPFEVVRFANGLQVMLDEDGRLRVIAEARGINRIVILPTSENSCRIEPIGKMYRPNTSVSGHCPPALGSTNKNQLSGG